MLKGFNMSELGRAAVGGKFFLPVAIGRIAFLIELSSIGRESEPQPVIPCRLEETSASDLHASKLFCIKIKQSG